MAIGDPYVSAGDLALRVGADNPMSYPGIVDAASRAVESFCGRQFNKAAPASPTARRFRPLDPYRLPVDDFYTITGLVVDVAGTVWDAATYDPQPWGGNVNGQGGWPFFNLFAVNRTWPLTATITVTAEWGWAAVPSAIKEATLDVAAAMVAGGVSYPVRSESIDGYSTSYAVNGSDVPPEMTRAIPYKRKRFGVA